MASYLNVPHCPPNYVPGQVVEVDRIDEFLGPRRGPRESDFGKQAIVKVVELGSDYDRSLIEKDEDFVFLVCEVMGENRVLELLASEVLIVSEPR